MKRQFVLKIRRSLLPCWLLLTPFVHGYELDPGNRWQIRDYYKTVYPYLSGTPMEWSGNYGNGDPGTVSPAWQESTRTRVNFYRRMAGLRDEVVFDPLLDGKCQQAALMMSANSRLSHEPLPPESWLFWTQDGFDAAMNGNLSLGSSGPDAVDGYMADSGTEAYPDWNNTVGHRRWILFPQTLVMGSGDVPGDTASGKREANTLWVFPEEFGPRPPTRDDFVAWPPRGHVPCTLVWPRWSLSYPNADFSNAVVTMQSNGENIPVTKEPFSYQPNYFPESTLVWVPDGMDASQQSGWPTPEADLAIDVSISNVVIAGQPQSFNYTVVIFDPDSTGPGEIEAELSGPDEVVTGTPAVFSVSSRDWSEGIQGRVLFGEDYEINLGAEGGLNPFLVSTSGGYPTIQTTRKGKGEAAFHLAHVTPPEPQTLTLPDEFIVTGNTPTLGFLSSLAWASLAQIAHVEVKVGSESNWQSIWSKSGPVASNDTFESHHLDLSAYIDRTIRIRFRYEHIPGELYFPGTDGAIGWAIDDIHLAGVKRIQAANELTPVWDSNQFTTTFTDPGSYFVQARDIAFGGFALEWGHVFEVVVNAPGSPHVPVGEWRDNSLLGWTFGASGKWKYSLTMGYVYTDDFPWIYTRSGWIHYLQGSVYGGLWFYHSQYGYAYTRFDYGSWFKHSPFDQDSWQRFFP